MDRHKRVPVAKRPLGVSIMMAGGLKGYSGCSFVQQMNQVVIPFEDRMFLNLLQPYLQGNAACLYTSPLRRVFQDGLPEENAILQRTELSETTRRHTATMI